MLFSATSTLCDVCTSQTPYFQRDMVLVFRELVSDRLLSIICSAHLQAEEVCVVFREPNCLLVYMKKETLISFVPTR